MRLAFGHQISSNNIETDPYVRIVEDAGLALNNSGPPDSNPIDLFPPREYIAILSNLLAEASKYNTCLCGSLVPFM